jgi:hypothetical protein
MNKKRIGLIAALVLLTLPTVGWTADQGATGMGGQSSSPSKTQQIAQTAQATQATQPLQPAQTSQSMQSMQGQIPLGDDTQYGVKATGRLVQVSPATQTGAQATWDFMVIFRDATNGATLTEGLVALKITDPSGATGAPLKLNPETVGAEKGFGTGVTFTTPGTYQFEVGSRLADGHKRQFNFTYLLQ